MENKKELEKKGYWSIASQKHFKTYAQGVSNLDEFDNISTSGKAGLLLGVIRGSEGIDNIKGLEKKARLLGINKQELHKIVIPELEAASDGEIEVKRSMDGTITHVEEYIFSQKKVLELTGRVLEKLNPSDIERVAIDAMDETKRSPLLESELFNYLSKQGYSEEAIILSSGLQISFNLLQKLTNNVREPIFSNEYVWGKNHEKIALAFANLDGLSKEEIKFIVQSIQNQEGFPLEMLSLKNPELLQLASKIGMISPTVIRTSREVEKPFGFSANLLNEYEDDLLDDVKLLLASIRFGENYTEYSRINDPVAFLNRLISSGRVGPHSANGTDYVLLEQRGIVRAVQDKRYSDRYYLELNKKDVAEKAREVLKSSNYLIKEDSPIESTNVSLADGSFKSPEECRISLGRLPKETEESMDYLTRVLRDETY